MIILYELEFDEFMWPRPADRRRGIMTSHEHAAMLRAAAEEMRAEDHAGWPNACDAAADHIMALASKLEKTENQNRFLRYWIRELREDGADAVSDPLYGMLLDRITELAKEDPAADSPDGVRLTALADLCEAYEKRRGESAVGIVTAESEVNSKSSLKKNILGY